MYNPNRARAGDEITAAMWNALNAELRRLGQVRVAGMSMHNGPGGLTLGVAPPHHPISAVVTTAITAAPNANTLGEGKATLRLRNAAALTDGPTDAVVYSNFSASIPVGTRIEVMQDGGAYKLLAANCPT